MVSPLDILMPKLGLTMTEGVLAEWNIAPGSAVRAGDIIFSVETEKVVNEIEAQQDGVVDTLLFDIGASVPVGTPVARFKQGSAPMGVKPSASDAAATTLEAPTSGFKRGPAAIRERGDAPAPRKGHGGRIVATPYARRLAREQKIDLSLIVGTGPFGRAKAADLKFIQSSNAASVAATALENASAPFGTPFNQYVVDVDVSRILALQSQVNSADSEISLCIFLVAAIPRAVALSPALSEALAARGTEARGVTSVLVRRRSGGATTLSVVAGPETMRLSDIGAAIAVGAGDFKRNEGRLPAITVTDVGLRSLRCFMPTLIPAQLLSASIGVPTSFSELDADGTPRQRYSAGLAMSVSGAIDQLEAAAFIEHVVHFLEQPMALLA